MEMKIPFIELIVGVKQLRVWCALPTDDMTLYLSSNFIINDQNFYEIKNWLEERQEKVLLSNEIISFGMKLNLESLSVSINSNFSKIIFFESDNFPSQMAFKLFVRLSQFPPLIEVFNKFFKDKLGLIDYYHSHLYPWAKKFMNFVVAKGGQIVDFMDPYSPIINYSKGFISRLNPELAKIHEQLLYETKRVPVKLLEERFLNLLKILNN